MDYKEEIQNTRKGCLGGSDGNLISQIASLGYVPNSAKKRLAVVKGFIENEPIPQTPAVKFGDFIEQSIYEHLAQGDESYQSNPLIVSSKYSRPFVKMIAHPDILRIDEANRVIYIYEVKATKYPVAQTLNTYRSQLYIESLLGKEVAQSRKNVWRVKLFLVHYSTEGLDLEHEAFEFDPQRITLKNVVFRTAPFDLDKAMDIIQNYVAEMDFYAPSEVVESKYLPEDVREKFDFIANVLREINRREDEVKEFKSKLYEYLTERGISKVQCGDVSFTVVAPSQQVSFDHKAYLADYEAAHPRKARKVKEKYRKVSDRAGYVKININD